MNLGISFYADGTAQCLWTEALPLHELGRLEIHRATTIEFNNSTQHWEVKDRRGKVRFFLLEQDLQRKADLSRKAFPPSGQAI